MRLWIGDYKSMALTALISPTPFTDVVTLEMSKSSAKGMNAPSARTNVSASTERQNRHVCSLKYHAAHQLAEINNLMLS